MRAYHQKSVPDSTYVNTFGLLRYQDAVQSTCLAALGSLMRNEEEKVVASLLLLNDPERPSTATMNRLVGKWTMFDMQNFEEFVRALNIGRTKRKIIESKMPFAHEIEPAENNDYLNLVIVSAESRMKYTLKVGSVEPTNRTNLLGDLASVTSRWSEDGSRLCEAQRMFYLIRFYSTLRIFLYKLVFVFFSIRYKTRYDRNGTFRFRRRG